MRKLFLIALLALSTLAWAKGKDHLKSQSSGNDWYNHQLSAEVNKSVRVNQTISPSATAFAERESFGGQRPGAMAGRTGGGEDFYNQKVAIQSEVSRRDLAALKQK
jgi:hypothetical protein